MSEIDNAILFSQLNHEEKGWRDTAAQAMRDVAYYQQLLDQTGQHLVPEIFKCDDGTTSKDVLRAKVPEVVEARMKEWRAMRDILLRIHSARIGMNEAAIIEQLKMIDNYFREPNHN